MGSLAIIPEMGLPLIWCSACHHLNVLPKKHQITCGDFHFSCNILDVVDVDRVRLRALQLMTLAENENPSKYRLAEGYAQGEVMLFLGEKTFLVGKTCLLTTWLYIRCMSEQSNVDPISSVQSGFIITVAVAVVIIIVVIIIIIIVICDHSHEVRQLEILPSCGLLECVRRKWPST